MWAISHWPIYPPLNVTPFLGAQGIPCQFGAPRSLYLSNPRSATCGRRAGQLAYYVADGEYCIGGDQGSRVDYSKLGKTLAAGGVDIEQPPIGVMVEVPSVLYLIKELAEYVEFFFLYRD